MALTGNGSYERLADMEDEHDLQRKQQLISDIWQALHILQDNQLLSTQLLETISNFTKDRCARLEGPNLDAEGPEALQNMGFLPRDE